MGRQCRRLLFRVIIGVPIVWFSVVGFMVVMSGGGIPSPHAYPLSMHQQTGAAVQGHPVIERPNFDQLRFQQRMQEDARLEMARLDAKRRMQKERVVAMTTRTPAMHIEPNKEPSVDRPPPDAPGRCLVHRVARWMFHFKKVVFSPCVYTNTTKYYYYLLYLLSHAMSHTCWNLNVLAGRSLFTWQCAAFCISFVKM